VVRDISGKVIANAVKLGIDAIITIGGDGSRKIGYELSQKGMKIVGVPKTIDNDLSAAQVTFGFDTALHTGLRVTLVTSRRCPLRVLIQRHFRVGIIPMNDLGLCLVGQLCLAFGVAGLFWPEKLMPFFEVLMFPWVASYRGIRANSIAAIGLSLLLFARLLTGIR